MKVTESYWNIPQVLHKYGRNRPTKWIIQDNIYTRVRVRAKRKIKMRVNLLKYGTYVVTAQYSSTEILRAFKRLMQRQ